SDALITTPSGPTRSEIPNRCRGWSKVDAIGRLVPTHARQVQLASQLAGWRFPDAHLPHMACAVLGQQDGLPCASWFHMPKRFHPIRWEGLKGATLTNAREGNGKTLLFGKLKAPDAARLPGWRLSSLLAGLESDTLKPPPRKLEALPGIHERSHDHTL